MIDDTLDKIRAAASNGLTKQEAAALIDVAADATIFETDTVLTVT